MKSSGRIYLLASGTLLALALAGAAPGCGDDSGDSGSSSSTVGSSASSGGSDAAGASASASATGTGGGDAGGTGGASGGTGGAGGGEGGSGGSASGTCPGPLDFDDGDPCTFKDPSCPSACGIEEMGSRNCACINAVADCDACAPPDPAKYPINPVAVDCSEIGGDGSAMSIRDTACTKAQEGTSCIGTEAPSARGCVCWDLGPGFQWECGSINKWFAKP